MRLDVEFNRDGSRETLITDFVCNEFAKIDFRVCFPAVINMTFETRMPKFISTDDISYLLDTTFILDEGVLV